MGKIVSFILVLAFLLVPVFGFTADQPLSKSLTFGWEQPVDLENITGWALYWSPTSGSGYVKVIDIPYAVGSGPTFTTATVLNVAGVQGSTVKKYFVLTASGKGGQNSAYSNEINYGFLIPYAAPAAPFNLILTVTVGP